MTYMREDDSAKTQCPFGENEKSKASPRGKAAEEFVLVDTRLMFVLRGCKNASNKFLFTSRANNLFNLGRLSSVKGPLTTLYDREKEGQRERWCA